MKETLEREVKLSPGDGFVLPELGGDITDTRNVVTFQDDFNIHVTIAAFPQDATQRWELSTRGLKDYLVYFFSNFVLADFRESFEGVQAESAKFVPSVQDGALLTYILIPGGTMFPERAPSPGAVAKRGNLVFVRNGHIFVVSATVKSAGDAAALSTGASFTGATLTVIVAGADATDAGLDKVSDRLSA